MKTFLAAFAVAAAMGIAASTPASAQTADGTRLRCLVLEAPNSNRVLNVCTCTREWNIPITIRKLLKPDGFRASIGCNFGGGGGAISEGSTADNPHSFVFSKASSYSTIDVDAGFDRHGKPKVSIDGTVKTNATGDAAAAGDASGKGKASGGGIGGSGDAGGAACASGGCQTNVSIDIH